MNFIIFSKLLNVFIKDYFYRLSFFYLINVIMFFFFYSLHIKRALLLRNFKKNAIIAGNKTARKLLFECMNIKHAMNCRLQKRIFVGS